MSESQTGHQDDGQQTTEFEGGVSPADGQQDGGATPEPGGAAPAGTGPDVEEVTVPAEMLGTEEGDKPEWVVETHGEPPAESADQYEVIR